MSGADKSEETWAVDKCCASCGTPEVDDVKLKICDGCDLVHYCSDTCQQDHRPEHDAKCKERAAELRDEILFKQPESTHLGDCPICFLPLPIDGGYQLMECCSKLICQGCEFANMTCRGLEQAMGTTCPFCRHLTVTTDEEATKQMLKRIEANDPIAIREMGGRHFQEEKNYNAAIEFFRRAAALGDVEAHFSLGYLYDEGKYVELDKGKALYHLEEAAIGGHPDARCYLACIESYWNEKYERAVKHWIIAANLGYDRAIRKLKEWYKDGLVSKDDFAAALRAHKASVDATKSPQRVAAQKFLDECG